MILNRNHALVAFLLALVAPHPDADAAAAPPFAPEPVQAQAAVTVRTEMDTVTCAAIEYLDVAGMVTDLGLTADRDALEIDTTVYIRRVIVETHHNQVVFVTHSRPDLFDTVARTIDCEQEAPEPWPSGGGYGGEQGGDQAARDRELRPGPAHPAARGPLPRLGSRRRPRPWRRSRRRTGSLPLGAANPDPVLCETTGDAKDA